MRFTLPTREEIKRQTNVEMSKRVDDDYLAESSKEDSTVDADNVNAEKASSGTLPEMKEDVVAREESSSSAKTQPKDDKQYPFASIVRPNSAVFVGNLFYDVTSRDLKNHMERYGNVLWARIIHDTRGISKG